ncbi:MAG: hydroxymethylglutaryl-CoA reductase, degradative [Candidatus Nitrosopelagicus sp.]|nr:hydroxymethylglutaryl-CoA reductase, degradative [Candidatus Nitrosopelagicus sp.]
MTDSSIPKFFEKSHEEKLDIICNFSDLTDDEVNHLKNATGGIDFEHADKMIENAIGTFSLPLGIATNFKINNKDYLVPMVIEEPSVIAAASKAAKIARVHGGFTATVEGNISIGQVQVLDVNIQKSISAINSNSNEIIELANSASKTLPKLGKGAKQIHCKEIKTSTSSMLIVELMIDVGDAMGANVTNTMCETVAPLIEKITGGKTLLRILSNYSTKRMVSVSGTFDKEAVGGEQVVNDIISAFEFADNDVYRAVTHNKGVMNGTISVANATGQDSRAIEAAAHAYASSTGKYRSLTKWEKDNSGNLVGKFEIPLSVGIVGGVTNDHPIAKICTKILKLTNVQDLACIMAATGLAQNFAAMRALVTEGIQKGHMKLHARKQASNS